MRKQHPAIVALDTLAGFGSHRAVCRQVRYSPRVTQAYCEDCRRLGKPINPGNNAYTAMLTHALNTAPETPGSEAAKKAVKAAIEALAQEQQASVSPEITAAILAERERYGLD